MIPHDGNAYVFSKSFLIQPGARASIAIVLTDHRALMFQADVTGLGLAVHRLFLYEGGIISNTKDLEVGRVRNRSFGDFDDLFEGANPYLFHSEEFTVNARGTQLYEDLSSATGYSSTNLWKGQDSIYLVEIENVGSTAALFSCVINYQFPRTT